jgi:hypothetical protein
LVDVPEIRFAVPKKYEMLYCSGVPEPHISREKKLKALADSTVISTVTLWELLVTSTEDGAKVIAVTSWGGAPEVMWRSKLPRSELHP